MVCRKCSKEMNNDFLFCPYCGTAVQTVHKKKTRGNGMGSAVKRGNSWRAVWSEGYRIDEDGTVHRIRGTKDGFKSKSAALQFAAGPHGKEEVKSVPTLNSYYSLYRDTFMKDISANKRLSYEIAWKKMESLHNVPMSELTVARIQSVIDEKTPTYYPARDIKTVLSHCYKAAIADGNARVNLSEYLHLPKLEEKELQPFTEPEIKSLWEAYGNGCADAALVLVMIYTGMMPGELRNLTADMINLDAREIVGAGLKTKKRKVTPVVVPDILMPVLSALMDGSPDGKIVHCSEDKFYQRYYAALDAAGTRRLTPYSCRHTTATALALGNIAPSIIQEYMRHSKFSTTQRYIHPDTDATKNAANSVLK